MLNQGVEIQNTGQDSKLHEYEGQELNYINLVPYWVEDQPETVQDVYVLQELIKAGARPSFDELTPELYAKIIAISQIASEPTEISVRKREYERDEEYEFRQYLFNQRHAELHEVVKTAIKAFTPDDQITDNERRTIIRSLLWWGYPFPPTPDPEYAGLNFISKTLEPHEVPQHNQAKLLKQAVAFYRQTLNEYVNAPMAPDFEKFAFYTRNRRGIYVTYSYIISDLIGRFGNAIKKMEIADDFAYIQHHGWNTSFNDPDRSEVLTEIGRRIMNIREFFISKNYTFIEDHFYWVNALEDYVNSTAAKRGLTPTEFAEQLKVTNMDSLTTSESEPPQKVKKTVALTREERRAAFVKELDKDLGKEPSLEELAKLEIKMEKKK